MGLCSELVPVVTDGDRADISLTPKVFKEFKKAKEDMRAAVLRTMRAYACNGQVMNKERYRKETTLTIQKKTRHSITVFAFKAFQLRVYGGDCQISGRRTWVGTGIDICKKKDKTAPERLKAAAEKLAEVVEAAREESDHG